jgi:hypothetical protein
MELVPATTWGRNITGNPSKLRASGIVELTVHYTGSPSVNIAKNEVAGYIKRIELEHKSRPTENMSTLGYNFLIDEYGRIWEGRGWDIRNGANGTKSNDVSISVCLLVGVKDNKISAEVIDAVRLLRATASTRFKRELKVQGHRDHKATSCPGEDVYKLVKNGAFLVAPGGAQVVPVPVAVKPVPVQTEVAACQNTVLRRGAAGACVELAQRRLEAHGFNPGPIDGKFGAKTEAAVRKFQQARGLTVDGVIGETETWPALTKAEPK